MLLRVQRVTSVKDASRLNSIPNNWHILFKSTGGFYQQLTVHRFSDNYYTDYISMTANNIYKAVTASCILTVTILGRRVRCVCCWWGGVHVRRPHPTLQEDEAAPPTGTEITSVTEPKYYYRLPALLRLRQYIKLRYRYLPLLLIPVTLTNSNVKNCSPKISEHICFTIIIN